MTKLNQSRPFQSGGATRTAPPRSQAYDAHATQVAHAPPTFASPPVPVAAPEATSVFDTAPHSAKNLATGAGAPSQAPLPQKSLASLLSSSAANVSITLTPHNSVRDELGMTHERLNVHHEGVPVFGEQLISHRDKNGKLTHVTGAPPSLPPGLGSGPVKLSADEARAIVKETHQKDSNNAPLQPRSTAERVIVRADDGRYHAAWMVGLSRVARDEEDGENRDATYLVEAHTGEVLTVASQNNWDTELLKTPHASQKAPSSPAHPQGSAKKPSVPVQGKGHTLYSGEVELATARRSDGSYKLKDSTRGKGVVTYDGENKIFDRERLEGREGKKRFIRDSNQWGEAEADTHTRMALDAHYGAQMMYDFMKDVLGRDSIDGQGAKIVSHVHVKEEAGAPMNNAFWCRDRMVYGDGDGKTRAPFTPLEIVGHEITHGLDQYTANLGRSTSGVTAALSESFADIMGMGMKWYAAQKNDAVKFTWTSGEQVRAPEGQGLAIRYMDEPKKNGKSIDHLDDLKPGTPKYSAAGISNNAFYLLAEGGKNSTSGQGVEGGIGMERAVKIFGHALITEMRPNDDFHGARQATLRAATALYGANSEEVRKLGEAWTAVGVRANAGPSAPK
ncbi:MAG: M4 family metallopeptidase [Cystobacter sp.]